jgi:hypothetical protein
MLHMAVSFLVVSLFVECNKLSLSHQAQVTLQLQVGHPNLV